MISSRLHVRVIPVYSPNSLPEKSRVMSIQLESSQEAEGKCPKSASLLDQVIEAIQTLTNKSGATRNQISDYLVSRRLINQDIAKAQVSKALYKGVTEGQIGLQKGTHQFIVLGKTHSSLSNEQAETIINFLVSLQDIMSTDTADMAKMLHKGLKDGVFGRRKGTKLILLLETFHTPRGHNIPNMVEGAGDLDHQKFFDFLIYWGIIEVGNAQILKELYEQSLRRVPEKADGPE